MLTYSPSRADLEEMRGHLDQAIELRKQAVTLDPLCSFCYLFLGNDLYQIGQYDEANTVLQKALELDPQQGYVHFVLGQILLAQGRPQEALVEMQRETKRLVEVAWRGNGLSLPGPSTGFGCRIERTHRQPW